MPYMIEEKLGIDMSYQIAQFVPNTLLKTKMRHAIKTNDFEEIKTMIFTGASLVDDPIDFYSCHTLLHDAVIMNREDVFAFLIK